MSALTVLHIIPRLDIGGAERNVMRIAQALSAAGHRALVISSGGSLVRELESFGARHFTWPVASKNPLTILKNTANLIDFARREHIDLIHAHSRAPAWSAYLACRRLNLPFVTTYHSAHKGTSALKVRYNGVMASGDRVIVASRFLAGHIGERHHVQPSRIALIPHGIDLRAFDPQAVSGERKKTFRAMLDLPAGYPLIVLPARLSPLKGHALALRALHAMKDVPFMFAIVGGDQGRAAYRRQLETLIHELGIGERVRMVEFADMPAVYAAADLVLNPSQVPEGFGFVPVEAQAMGVPVIATAAGATLETVIEGQTGWLVPPGDEKALTAAIRTALALTEEQREAMAAQAIGHARKNYDAEQTGRATLDVYASLLRERERAGR